MTQNILEQLKLCKYEQYINPQRSDSISKQTTPNNRLNSLKKNQIFGTGKFANELSGLETPFHPILSKNLLMNKYGSHKKLLHEIKLQKVTPKSIIIKFKQGKTQIIRKNQQNIHKNFTDEPKNKFLDFVQNRMYMQYLQKGLNIKNNSEQNKQNSKNQTNYKFDTLFNVRSIKINKKQISTMFQNKNDLLYQLNRVNSVNQCNFSQKNNKKYNKLFKKQYEMSLEMEKEYPRISTNSHEINVKLTYKELKKIAQNDFQRSPSCKLKYKKSSPGNKSKIHSKNLSFIEQKYRLSDQKGQTSSIYNYNNPNNMFNGFSKNLKTISNEINLKIPTCSLSQETSSMSKSTDQFSGTHKLYQHLSPSNLACMNNKKDFIFEKKLIKYKTMLAQLAELHGIELQFVENYPRNQFSFYVGKGNNSILVKQVLKKRWWLRPTDQKKNISKSNIIWTQLKQKSYYQQNNNQTHLISKLSQLSSDQLSHFNEDKRQSSFIKQIIHNHFEQNEFLGNKKALFYNMKFYYTAKGLNVFDFLPLTFHIISYNDNSWKQFMEYYQQSLELFKQGKSKNIWILKPGQNSNRGNGITVHSTFESIEMIIKAEKSEKSQKPPRSFILQKYIQKPFLYNKRKFDIRCYMLLVRLNQKIKAYWYKQGYIRTSCFQFSLNDCQNNKFVHLTNDAVQVNCQAYGKYEDGNKLSYDTFQKYLDFNYNINQEKIQQKGQEKGNINNNDKKFDIYRDIIPKIKSISLDSVLASYTRIGKWRQQTPTFQLFGLDFMIDEAFNPWLIQINTNPCLQTSSRVLQKIIPSLLDNVFKLSIDLVFPPPLNWSNCTKHTLSKNVDQNQFQLMFDQNQIQIRNSDKKQYKEFYDIGQIEEDSEIYEEDEK